MNRLQCISELKEGEAMAALDQAIETIRDHCDRWRFARSPEERAFTNTILGTLIDLQVVSVTEAVRMGTAMHNRLTQEAIDEREAA